MAYMITDIRDAVDRNFLVTKNMSKQVESGTIVHIMDSSQAPDGTVVVNYRVIRSGQDFVVKFKSLKDFAKWARPDDFIARYQESFSKAEILHYIRVSNRTFASFCVPLMLVFLAAIWAVIIFLLKPTLVPIIIGAVASLIAILVITIIYKKSKTSVKINLYRKVSSKNWGVSF